MKQLMSLLFCLMGSIPLTGFCAPDDLRGVTVDGRKVILKKDGTWRFDEKLSPLNSTSSAERSPYQPAVKKFSVSYDAQKWISTSDKEDMSNKRIFKHKKLPVYSMVISDEIPATNEMVKRVVIYNAKKAGAEPTIVVDESRKVDGKDVGVVSFVAALQDIEFMFTGNYYGDENGNIQVMCYTAVQLFHKYQNECNEFINGLHIK